MDVFLVTVPKEGPCPIRVDKRQRGLGEGIFVKKTPQFDPEVIANEVWGREEEALRMGIGALVDKAL